MMPYNSWSFDGGNAQQFDHQQWLPNSTAQNAAADDTRFIMHMGAVMKPSMSVFNYSLINVVYLIPFYFKLHSVLHVQL
jgi:hypothetical protein